MQKHPAEPLRLDECYHHFHRGFLKDRRFSFIWLLLYWPLYGLCFFLLEKDVLHQTYYPVHCALDDLIPFCEWFFIPYMFWFVYLVGMFLYAGFCEVDLFRKMMYFTILTYSATLVIYFFFPTMQELRPETFERDNILTRFIADFYAFDTNTNVCPSLHVIGSFVVQTAAWNSRRFRTVGWRIVFTAIAVLISISVVFMKQHSVLDIPPALLLCVLAYIPVYWLPEHRRKKAEKAKKAAEEAAVAGK